MLPSRANGTLNCYPLFLGFGVCLIQSPDILFRPEHAYKDKLTLFLQTFTKWRNIFFWFSSHYALVL